MGRRTIGSWSGFGLIWRHADHFMIFFRLPFGVWVMIFDNGNCLFGHCVGFTGRGTTTDERYFGIDEVLPINSWLLLAFWIGGTEDNWKWCRRPGEGRLEVGSRETLLGCQAITPPRLVFVGVDHFRNRRLYVEVHEAVRMYVPKCAWIMLNPNE